MNSELSVFIEVVEKQNFTRAAEALHMTQPAVSQYIQALEASIGTKLLVRDNKKVQLNKAGEIVYYHAKEIMGLHMRMQNLIDDLLHKASGELAIGASYTFGEYILPHIVGYLKRQYPLIRPKITIANTKRIAEWVGNNQLEIGIVDGEVSHPELAVEPFAEDQMYIVVAANHPDLNNPHIRLKDLAEETWIVREATSGTRAAIEGMFRQFGFYPKNIMEFGSTQTIKECVTADLGITLLSQFTIQKDLLAGTLKILQVADMPVCRKFSLITQTKHFRTKALDIFIDILRNKEGFLTIGS
jgi:Transcriptional regulator